MQNGHGGCVGTAAAAATAAAAVAVLALAPDAVLATLRAGLRKNTFKFHVHLCSSGAGSLPISVWLLYPCHSKQPNVGILICIMSQCGYD